MTRSYRDTLTGPFCIFYVPAKNRGVWTSYEHGAPDGDVEQAYFSILTERSDGTLGAVFSVNKGAYFDNQSISQEAPYSTVWYAYDLFDGASRESADGSIWQYLLDYICEIPDSRKPLYYYNTWGMQRDESSRGNDIRGILTEEKVKQEIADAAELGIDLFVLDDGWQDKFGDWNVHQQRLPRGLRFYVDELKKRGITPGLWIATRNRLQRHGGFGTPGLADSR